MTSIPNSAPAARPEDENLGIGANLLYGLQHVLTMYGGIVAVPLIVGQAAGLSPADIGLLIAASLFVGGAATLLQTLGLPFFGCQLPLVQGVSFASVATIVAIVGANGGEGGLPVVFGAVIGAAPCDVQRAGDHLARLIDHVHGRPRYQHRARILHQGVHRQLPLLAVRLADRRDYAVRLPSTPALMSSERTVSVGIAPFAIHASAWSLSTFNVVGLVRGL